MGKYKKSDCYNDLIAESKRGTDNAPGDFLYAIPYRDQYIIYRPLKRIAFIANKSMVDLTARLFAGKQIFTEPSQQKAKKFLQSIGFFEPNSLSISSLGQSESDFRPTIVVLLLTTSCNFRCVYCYASSGSHRGGVMPLETGYAAIDIACRNARDKGRRDFSLCFHGGGEPTLVWQRFRKLVKYARSRPLPARISLATNGYWDEQKRDWILDNINEISLSCDGLPDIHNKQRPLRNGMDTFKVVFNSIREMDKNKIAYGVRLTVTESNIHTLPHSMEFLCKETNCASFQAEPAFDHGRAKTEKQAVVNQNQFIRAFLSAYDIAKNHHRNLFYSGARPYSLTDSFCQAPTSALIVTKDGQLTTCYEIFDPSLELGDSFFIGSLTSDRCIAIDKGRHQALLEKIRQRRELCKKCFCYWHCAGDCPAKTISSDGAGHLQFGARCKLNREITKELVLRYIHEFDGVWMGQSKQHTQLWNVNSR